MSHTVSFIVISCTLWMKVVMVSTCSCRACASLRCSSLLSVAAEWKLHPEEVEPEVCRSRLQLFSLAGGASRTDLRGSVICSQLSITWARRDMMKWYPNVQLSVKALFWLWSPISHIIWYLGWYQCHLFSSHQPRIRIIQDWWSLSLPN